jgi:lipopolysaccharide/colanic/teichoic acid biosynthesis glycosyltransferase
MGESILVNLMEDSSSHLESEAQEVRALYIMGLEQAQGTHSRTLYGWAKRAIDVIVSTVLLVLLSPLMLAIGIVVKATSPGPSVLIQERVGRDGRVFPFYKFRSMYQNPDRSAEIKFAREYINGRVLSTVEWNGIFKPANDARVTPVGRLLRKASLDELPQLFNVLKGDMSLVGPRPSMPYEVDAYKTWHLRRLEVLPGITGLAQIRGRSSLTFRDIVRIDIEYIERRSLLLDLKILLRTLPVVISGHGAR